MQGLNLRAANAIELLKKNWAVIPALLIVTVISVVKNTNFSTNCITVDGILIEDFLTLSKTDPTASVVATFRLANGRVIAARRISNVQLPATGTTVKINQCLL